MSEISLFKRSIAELIGTYVLVFLGTGSVVTAVLLVQGASRIPENTFNVGLNIEAWFAIGIAFAIAIIAMIYAFGHISGTHINPAVSIALWATGRFPAKDMMGYIVAQLIGASLASFTIVAILGSRAVDTGLGATAMFDGVSYSQAMLCEAVATFFLMLTIMGSSVDKRAPAGFAGLAIGLVVAADIIVVGNITGSSLNPARTFGPYLADFMLGGTNFWWQFPIYIIGPIVGALVAAFVYDYVTELKSCE
ncbi:MAG: MIP family channel protein [Methanohalophilus sp. T328-1]|uniref:MIP/aquaporin family protein n=1 Tax=Methanohalophilus sp. DAL1 TaxID=1864608 RepID=UPI0007959097|nr:MIP/aquaporin family protein [Methanohalophilus sp. DAL1]KXS45613.1 MAG: MIP family channel protein [Methanohalophilus sp. T328-1]OBZ35064.1 MAG: aquaporin [Methanohalophilus sp. DAL1]